MKIHIIYESHFGNGKKCVEYLKDTISKKGHDVEMFSVIEVQPDTLQYADLYIFSTPTHTNGPPKQTKIFLKNFKVRQEGAKYVLITTHMAPEIDTLQIMEKLLQSKGMIKISDGLKIKVTTMRGPLEKDYELKLDSFAKKIIDEN